MLLKMMKIYCNKIILASLLIIFACAVVSTQAQITAFSSAPVYSLTFDSAPTNPYPGYEWQSGRFPHAGLAYFDGISRYATISNLTDAAGRSLPNIGGGFSLEFWVSFENWASMSHFFDVSNGAQRDNIFVSNLDTGNGVRFGTSVALSTDYSTYSEKLLDRLNSLSAGVFTHVVATATIISPSNTATNESCMLSLYLNGALVMNRTQYVIPSIARSNAWLGKSSWSNNALFTGWLDTVNVYNYPMPAQAVLGHALLVRAPAFELTIGQNPTFISGSSATYSFVLQDPADVAANVSQWHEGVVTLDGSSQYIDLATSSGSSTAGTTLPTIGGAGYGTGTNNFDQGWTFEVAFRVSAINSNSKIFDFSNNGNDRIYLGFESGSALYFKIQRGSTSATSTSILSSVTTNTWYHIVISVVPTNMVTGTADHRIYVNGVSVANATGNYPDGVSRPNAYVGKSVVSTDSYCALTFDLLRIHDYALTPLQALYMYYSVSQPAPTNPIPPPTIPSTAARHTFNFDAQRQQTGYSSYTFVDNTNDGHFGVAAFNGVNSSVNLLYYPDSNGETFSPVIGGTSMTFSVWAKWLDVAKYSRILDLAGPLGIADNNIILANYDASTQLFFRIYSGDVSTTCYAPGAVHPGNWQHIVAVVEKNETDTTNSVYGATLKLYIDGKFISSNPSYLPPRVYRHNLLVARSNWVADARFRGYIDSLQYYEYALDPQQIQAFACSTRPPVFDFSFNRDPRTLNTSLTYNYGWLTSDPEILPPNSILNPTSQNVTFMHQGMLTFDGTSQYANLTATSGPTNIGIQLPIIGGPGSGVGSYVGWTVEISFKITGYSRWAKFFDWGVNANGDDDILLGFVDNTHQVGFEVFNSRVRNEAGNAKSTRAILINEANLNQWYHVVIVITPTDIPSATATWTPYVDGEVLDALTTGVWPDAILRRNANIAKSNWQDAFFSGLIDSIRVYDYALTENSVRCLHRASRSVPEVVLPSPLFYAGPRNSYSFETGYDEAQSSVASYTWAANVDGRSGIATFDGITSYVNMLGYTDGRQRSFPNVMGGTDLTFTAWVRFSSFQQYSRIFDIGNGAGVNNFALMNVAATSNIGFHLYSSYGTTPYNPTLSWPSNQWVHVAVTVVRNPNVDTISANNAAAYSIYFNGSLVGSTTGYYSTNAERLFAYLGRSGWTGDARFNGAIDTWSWYDYALPLESIQTHARLSKPPYFELTFATDPRLPTISSTFLYNWTTVDANDPSGTIHRGILDLDGPSNYYVDLMQTRGNHSIGVLMPTVGGVSSGSQSFGTYGWSFEVVFKYESITNYCKIMDLGNGANSDGIVGDDQVILGLRGTSGLFTFEAINSRTHQQSIMNLVDPVTTYQWYSAIVVVEPTDLTNFRARYTGYVNGIIVNTATNQAYPQDIYRESGFLGKSEWSADSLCDVKLDLLRIYDYALSSAEVSMLVSRTMDPYVPPANSSSSSSTGGVTPRSSSSSSSTVVSSDHSCRYTAEPPSGTIIITLIFRNIAPTSLPADFGKKFAEAVMSVSFIPTSTSTINCTALVSNGVIYNTDPAGPTDTQVRFYIVNTDGRAEELYYNFQNSIRLPSSLQLAFNYYLGTQYRYDLNSVVREGTTSGDKNSGGSSIEGGAIAGIVIGVIIGVVLLILLAYCFLRQRSGTTKSAYAFEKNDANHQYDTQVDDTNETHQEGHEESDTVEMSEV